MTLTPTAHPIAVRHAVTLERVGRTPWSEARDLLTGTMCAWADLTGFHVQPAGHLPENTPIASHLWAWTTDHYYRLRFDAGDALIAALTIGDELADDDLPPAGNMIGVISTGETWAETTDRPGSGNALRRRFDLIEVAGPSPATFIRETKADQNT